MSNWDPTIKKVRFGSSRCLKSRDAVLGSFRLKMFEEGRAR